MEAGVEGKTHNVHWPYLLVENMGIQSLKNTFLKPLTILIFSPWF